MISVNVSVLETMRFFMALPADAEVPLVEIDGAATFRLLSVGWLERRWQRGLERPVTDGFRPARWVYRLSSAGRTALPDLAYREEKDLVILAWEVRRAMRQSREPDTHPTT